jgi:hypothetical protein
LLLRAGINGASRQQLDQCFTSFSRLKPKTQTALQFYRMREKANRPAACFGSGRGRTAVDRTTKGYDMH